MVPVGVVSAFAMMRDTCCMDCCTFAWVQNRLVADHCKWLLHMSMTKCLVEGKPGMHDP